MKGTLNVDVALAPAELHRRLLSPDRLLAAVPDVGPVRRVQGDGGVGSRYEATLEAAGRRETVTATLVDSVPPRRVAYDLTADIGSASLGLDVEAAGAGSRLVIGYEVRLRGLARLAAGPLAKAWLSRHEDELTRRIAKVLEGPPRAGRARG